MSIGGQLVDVLTKGPSTTTFQTIVGKLGMENIHSPACGGMLENILVPDKETCTIVFG